MRQIGAEPLNAAERQKRYRERHPERCNTAKGEWALANPEKFKEGERRRNKAYRDRNPDKGLVRNAKFRTTVKGAACYLYWNAKRRAKVDGLEFTITKEWIIDAVANGKCQITGIPFVLQNGRKPWAPSLDKTNPKLGYTPDNVKVVVWIYNTCKWDNTHEDVVAFAKALMANEKITCDS